MKSASPIQFHVYLPQVNACLSQCLNSVFNVKGESTSRRRPKQGGAFSVMVKLQSALRLAFSSTSLAIQLQGGKSPGTAATIYLSVCHLYLFIRFLKHPNIFLMFLMFLRQCAYMYLAHVAVAVPIIKFICLVVQYLQTILLSSDAK